MPKVHGSYRALLDDSEIDAIYIPLPNELHKPWVVAAADAGKHVLCEKPLALDAGEAGLDGRALPQARRDLDGSLHVATPAPDFALLEMVRGGAIGTLRLVRSSFSFPIEGDDWRLDPARGGGLCLTSAAMA